ncbi:PepSY domain-containing protein [Oceanobacillus kapialis]|uniref:PepSY domain-containing protein n=1 Tax=Oceanobacillus kapialis TaxID=481353 RepID=UPI00384CF8EF
MIIGSTVGALVLAIGVYQASADAKDPKLNTDETRKAVTEQYSDNTKNLQQEKEAMKAVYKAEVTDEKKQTALKRVAGKNNGDDNHDDNGNDSHDDNHDDNGNDSRDDNHDDNGNDSHDDNHDDNGNDNRDDNYDDNGNDSRDDDHDDNGSDSRDDDHDDKGNNTRDDDHDDNSDDSRDDDHDDNGDDNNRNVQARELMSEKEIIAIAKKKFDGDVRSVEIDEDDGRTVYEIELSKGNKTEADFEIDAITGEILEMNIDTDNDDDDDNDDNDDNDDDDDDDDNDD